MVEREYLHGSGTIRSKSEILSSNQSTTLFLSVTLTNPTANPFSLACFIYSAPEDWRRSHARYTASKEKKSWGDADGSVELAPGLRSRVGADFGKETVDERTI